VPYGCCRYKLKQKAIFKQMALTGNKNPNLSHAKQLELMVTAWHNAFSQETNERAWRKGGFGKDGIDMAPLWKQLKREGGELVDGRALSTAECARNAASEFGLNRTFEFDRWLTKPYEQSSHELENELDVDANDEPDGVTTTRLPVAELHKMRCPANSEPAKKLRAFHDNIVNLKTYLMPKLKELMEKHLPDVKYTCVNDAKAYLAHFLQGEFNKLTLKHRDRTIKVVFDARKKLPKDLRNSYDKLFGSKRAATEDADTTGKGKGKKSKAQAPHPKPFGWGAMGVD